MTYEIIASGSKGNAVVIDGAILIDCGVPYKAIQPYANDLRIVLLTHEHGDHFREATIHRLAHDRPALRWGCCKWLVQRLIQAGVDARCIDVLNPEESGAYLYGIDYGKEFRQYFVEVFSLVHNVPNCGFIIEDDDGFRLFYATDTGTLEGVEAKDCDLYMIECNHTAAEIEQRAAEKEAAGQYAYERRAAENHLSEEQAMDFFAANASPTSLYIPMHRHGGGRDAE